MCVRSGLQSDCINCGEVTQECWRVWECSSCSERGVRSAGRRAALHGDGCLACASIRLPHVLCLTHTPTPPSPCLLSTRQGTYTDQTGQGECKACSAGTWTEITMPGLLWEALGSVPPSTGAQFIESRLEFRGLLATKLQRQVQFTEEDLAKMGLVSGSLSYDMYVLVEARADGTPTSQYYRPIKIGATTCLACPEGSASSGTGCLACDKGQYSDSTGQTRCLNCRAGRYADEPGSTSCKDCPAGRWSTVMAARSNATCNQLCPPGTFSLVHGSFQESDCKECTTGNRMSIAGSSFCVCKPGYTGEACVACSAGTYKVETGDQACTACPALSRSAAASLARTDCLCNAGTAGPNGRSFASLHTIPSPRSSPVMLTDYSTSTHMMLTYTEISHL